MVKVLYKPDDPRDLFYDEKFICFRCGALNQIDAAEDVMFGGFSESLGEHYALGMVGCGACGTHNDVKVEVMDGRRLGGAFLEKA